MALGLTLWCVDGKDLLAGVFREDRMCGKLSARTTDGREPGLIGFRRRLVRRLAAPIFCRLSTDEHGGA